MEPTKATTRATWETIVCFGADEVALSWRLVERKPARRNGPIRKRKQLQFNQSRKVPFLFCFPCAQYFEQIHFRFYHSTNHMGCCDASFIQLQRRHRKWGPGTPEFGCHVICEQPIKFLCITRMSREMGQMAIFFTQIIKRMSWCSPFPVHPYGVGLHVYEFQLGGAPSS